jgi:hypothetical protein
MGYYVSALASIADIVAFFGDSARFSGINKQARAAQSPRKRRQKQRQKINLNSNAGFEGGR